MSRNRNNVPITIDDTDETLTKVSRSITRKISIVLLNYLQKIILAGE